ncbi:MAG: ABC transporter substrate-binding protein, partial [Rhodospirillaceae bacterium]|nr:ABC transporter substrate-binding protein [Rhodospirillaceae bacterium]
MADVQRELWRLLNVLVALSAMCIWPAGVRADTDVLRIGTTAMPPSLGNPFRNTGTPHVFTWSAVFDGLTRIDRNGVVRPWLAVGWENLNPLTWRLALRPGVKFSNGTPFTAEAVVNIVTFLTGPAAVREVVARELNFLASARAIDPLTVELTTKEPVPLLPRHLQLLYMVEPDAWRQLGPDGFARAPVATGPYAIDRMDESGWRLSAFAGSWRAPRVAKLRWIAAPDAASRVQAVLADQMDIALGLGPDEVAAIEAGGGKGATWRTAANWALQFHQVGRNGPFNDRRVREALNLAVDRRALVDGLLAGTTVPATQPATQGTFGHNPDLPPIPHDPARARALLA